MIAKYQQQSQILQFVSESKFLIIILRIPISGDMGPYAARAEVGFVAWPYPADKFFPASLSQSSGCFILIPRSHQRLPLQKRIPLATNRQNLVPRKAQAARRPATRCQALPSVMPPPNRRESISQLLGLMTALAAGPALADAMVDDTPGLCDVECARALSTVERVTTPSGLQFQDVVVGTGPSPPVGYQIVVNYVAMTPEGRIFESSLQRKAPFDIRVGAGQIVAGLDEGVRTMRVGGIRRLYIPGNLAFPKGLPSGPGRPRVPPSSPVVFDVQLLLIPGLDNEE